MIYLDSFNVASEISETEYILSNADKTLMTCYNGSIYPFKIFPFKDLSHIGFESVTMFYGGNGSGKSTLLNIIAQKLGLEHSAPWNNTPYYEDYLKFCKYKLAYRKKIPPNSRIVTSDDVFDYLLDKRTANDGIADRRNSLFEEYLSTKDDMKHNGYNLQSLDDYGELKYRNEIRRKSLSSFVSKRNPNETVGKSNGESAYDYFTEIIKENALYLLDEPENSLSAALQAKLAEFIYGSARFYNCQFIICTHSPFLLCMDSAVVYDLDSVPATVKPWSELENVKMYYKLFSEHKAEFE